MSSSGRYKLHVHKGSSTLDILVGLWDTRDHSYNDFFELVKPPSSWDKLRGRSWTDKVGIQVEKALKRKAELEDSNLHTLAEERDQIVKTFGTDVGDNK